MESIIEFIVEFILEIFIEGGMEAVSNKKIPKYIRYFLATLLVLFFGAVILGILLVGITIFKKNIVCALFLIICDFILLASIIWKCRKTYQELKTRK